MLGGKSMTSKPVKDLNAVYENTGNNDNSAICILFRRVISLLGFTHLGSTLTLSRCERVVQRGPPGKAGAMAAWRQEGHRSRRGAGASSAVVSHPNVDLEPNDSVLMPA